MSTFPPSKTPLFPALSTSALVEPDPAVPRVEPNRAISSDDPALDWPATFTVNAIQQIAAQLAQVTFFSYHEFNIRCREIKLLLQYLDSFPPGDLSSNNELSSHLVDIIEV
jgi:hypothetical protein